MEVAFDLLQNSNERKFMAAGEVIFHQGDPGCVMYAVAEGVVEIQLGDTVLEEVTTGSLFGEMALIDGSPRSATAVAKTDCQIVPIDQRRFLFMVQQTPFFAIQVLRLIASRLRAANERLC